MAEIEQGGIGDLFDYSFTKFVTPTVIRILYVLVLLFAAVLWAVAIIEGFILNWRAGLWGIIGGGLLFFIALLLYRIVFELVMVVFKIKEDTDRIGTGGATNI